MAMPVGSPGCRHEIMDKQGLRTSPVHCNVLSVHYITLFIFSKAGLPFGGPCPAGHYCPAGTKQPREMPCPVGTWNEQKGGRDPTWCLPCPPGFFCSGPGRISPTGPCAPGENIRPFCSITAKELLLPLEGERLG